MGDRLNRASVVDAGLQRHGADALRPLRRRVERPPAPAAIVNWPEPDVVEDAKHLVRAVRDGQDLSDAERTRLAALAQTIERPSFFLDAATFDAPLGHWEALAEHRLEIERAGSGVGRLEMRIGGREQPVGTGFIVGRCHVLTNRHVALKFARRDGAHWVVARPLAPTIDFAEERGAPSPREHAVEAVEWLAPLGAPDAALLRIASRDATGRRAPPALPVASGYRPRKQRRVYLIGYPSRLANSPDPDVMDLVFAGVYDVKRLQPGRILRSGRAAFEHDASTLGGNSGSCVIDVAEGVVVGLHYDGRARVANYAVPLWKRGVLDEIRDAFTG